METFKQYFEYPEYIFGSCGTIYDSDTCIPVKPRKKVSKNRQPYLYVYLRHSKKQLRTRSVHSLVMQIYGPKKPSEQHTIDHLDRNTLNNNISNLRWATPCQQNRNRKNSKNPNKLSNSDLETIFQRTKTESMKNIAKDYNIYPQILTQIMRYVHPEY